MWCILTCLATELLEAPVPLPLFRHFGLAQNRGCAHRGSPINTAVFYDHLRWPAATYDDLGWPLMTSSELYWWLTVTCADLTCGDLRWLCGDLWWPWWHGEMHAGHAAVVGKAVVEQRRRSRSQPAPLVRNPQASGHFSVALDTPLRRPETRNSLLQVSHGVVVCGGGGGDRGRGGGGGTGEGGGERIVGNRGRAGSTAERIVENRGNDGVTEERIVGNRGTAGSTAERIVGNRGRDGVTEERIVGNRDVLAWGLRTGGGWREDRVGDSGEQGDETAGGQKRRWREDRVYM